MKYGEWVKLFRGWGNGPITARYKAFRVAQMRGWASKAYPQGWWERL